MSRARLAVVAAVVLATAGAVAAPAVTSARELYEVRPGDTLAAIADSFGLSVSDLAGWNGLDDPNRIVAGQKLRLSDGVERYTVQPGDWLSAIAAAHGVAVGSLASANGIGDPNQLNVGQVLIIPAEGTAAAIETTVSQYVVQPGDSLAAIAERLGVTLESIARVNKIEDVNRLYAGQVIDVPGQSASAPVRVDVRYTVKAGDSLGTIANEFGVTVAAIAEANDLENLNLLRVGAVLVIPGADSGSAAPTQTTTRTYTVQPGDTLAAVAERHHLSVGALAAANGISDPNLVRIGQVLTLPVASAGTPPGVARSDARAAIVRAANEFGVPTAFYLGLTWLESGWQHNLVSSAGAVGLAQVLPETANWTAEVIMGEPGADWFGDYRQNARVGAAHLAHLLELSNGDQPLAAAAYYQGWESLMTYGMFNETVDYVSNVMVLTMQFEP